MVTTPAALRALAAVRDRLGQPAIELAASGTAAIAVALEILGIGPGDEVIVPDLGCPLIAGPVVRAGATPVFVGVGPTLTLTVDAVDAARSPRTRAVIAVHEFGLPCDVAALVECVGPEVAVIEDAARAWGLATTATLAVTSFGPGKPLSLGAGGALLGPAALVTGAVSRGDAREGHLARPPSPARFPLPLLDALPAALAAADAALAARRARVAAFASSPLAARFRLPPTPATALAPALALGPSSALAPTSALAPSAPVPAWTTLPLYPDGPVRAEDLRALRAALGPVGLLPRVPPSGLPVYRAFAKRVVPGPPRADPLLISLPASLPASLPNLPPH